MTAAPQGTELGDDTVHEPGDDRRWRESYYFTFYDPARGLGGFSSIGKRPGSGHTGFVNCLWGPDMPTLLANGYGQRGDHDDVFDVAGLGYRRHEPHGRWDLRFDGALNDGGSEIECDPAALATTESSPLATVPVAYDLEFVPTHPSYLYAQRPEWSELFTGHVDQVGRVRGVVRIDGTEVEVDGLAAKDHSWGVRNWFAPRAWRWIDLVFSGAPPVSLWRASFDGETWVADGGVYRDDRPVPMSAFSESIRTQPRAGKPLPAGIDFTVETAHDRVAVHGEVVRVVPVTFTRDVDGVRQTSWNDRALVRCTTDGGATGWANIEFQEQV